MRKSLPSYEHIKDKYTNAQALSPIEIGRGIVFLLIEELAHHSLPNESLSDKSLFDNDEFNLTMLQNLTELGKQHLDTYEMVYYTTIMICCIRCLVHENKYYSEKLAKNINACIYARQKLEQIEFINQAISETKDKNLLKTLKKIKNNCLISLPKTKSEAEYKDISFNLLLQLSAIYKFAEIISLNWEIPELGRLFYSPTKKFSYNTWLKAAVGVVNKHIHTEPKLDISDIKIQKNYASTISQLLEGRYLDISRINPFLKALKEGIGLTISGGSQ